jgi:hypothetical protein
MEHSFNVNIAKQYGVNIAIFLNNIAFWTFFNLATNKNIHDGLCWTYNSYDAFLKIFPYWTKQSLETIIKQCIKHRLLIKGNYNKSKYDRTCWYALTRESYKYFDQLEQLMNEKTLENPLEPLPSLISYNQEMEKVESRNQNLEIKTPIPDIKPDKKNNSIYTPLSADITEPPNSKGGFTVQDLLADNPHGIVLYMLEEWLLIRKKKKAMVGRTAWNKINKTLGQIENELNISPITAFETMVANCWLSLDVKYFKDDNQRNGKPNKEIFYL